MTRRRQSGNIGPMSTFEALLTTQFPHSQLENSSFWKNGSQAISSEDWVSPLFHYDFLRVDGPDSSTFLQGQTSCDWRGITSAQASRGSYCNIKGRVLSSFIGVTPSETRCLLRMRADICASSRSLLQKYIVFSKAEICREPRRHYAIGVAGPRATQRLEHIFGDTPKGLLQSLTIDPDTIIVQLDEEGERYECWLSNERATALWPKLSHAVLVCDSTYWERDNILQGIADVSAATQDLFLPQQLNYQLTGAVNFKKGCYTGQEVIARIQYRGKLKRRLYPAKVNTVIAENEGSELFTEDHQQSIGNIVSLHRSNDQSVLLAVLTIDAIDKPIYTAEGKHVLTLLPSPYSLPEI